MSGDDFNREVDRFGEKLSKSNYFLYNGEVYFLRNGDGYFKVKDADCKTFSPLLRKGQYSSDMGMDAYSVFCGTEKLKNIDRNTMRYIGAYFTADAHHVFYKDEKVEGADVQTFDLAAQLHNNSYKHPYARDAKCVYYRQYLLPELNPDQVRGFEQVSDYIADNNNAYYRNIRLEGVDGRYFRAKYVDYQLTYATDGRLHFVNGKPFPDKVLNIYWGNMDVDKPSLRLLVKKNIFAYHMVFYDKHNVYYFDESKQKIIHREHFSDTLNLKVLDDGLFTDGENIFFCIKERLRGRRDATKAERTKIVRLKNVKAESFRKVRELERGTLWYDGKSYYCTGEISNKYGRSSLKLLKSEPSDEVTRADVDGEPSYSSWIEINTRRRSSFDRDTD